jgi:hypothetical protein
MDETNEVEALEKVYREAQYNGSHEAGLIAVRDAVLASLAARGGTLSADSLREVLEPVRAERPQTVVAIRQHLSAQGATNAALQQRVTALVSERDEWKQRAAQAEREYRLMEADWDDLAGRCAGAEQGEREQKHRAISAESALVTLRLAVAALLAEVPKLPMPDGLSGDEESGEHDEDCALCQWEAIQAMADEAASTTATEADADMKEVLAMTDEQVDAELRAGGVDVEAFAERTLKHVAALKAWAQHPASTEAEDWAKAGDEAVMRLLRDECAFVTERINAAKIVRESLTRLKQAHQRASEERDELRTMHSQVCDVAIQHQRDRDAASEEMRERCAKVADDAMHEAEEMLQAGSHRAGELAAEAECAEEIRDAIRLLPLNPG